MPACWPPGVCAQPPSKALLERGVRRPFLVISVAQKRQLDDAVRLVEINRYLYSLDRGWCVLDFAQPGEFVVHAAIVRYDEDKNLAWKKDQGETAQQLAGWFLRTDGHGSFVHTLTDGETFVEHWFNAGDDVVGNAFVHEEINVRVDEGLFAREPSPFVWWWVNLWHEGRPKDQCMFRRRAIISVFKVPVFLAVMAIWIPLGALLGVFYFLLLKLFTWRKASLRPIFSLNSFSLSEINTSSYALFDDNCPKDMYWCVTDSTGKQRELYEAVLLIPFVWVVVIAFGSIIFLEVCSQVVAGVTIAVLSSIAFMSLLAFVMYIAVKIRNKHQTDAYQNLIAEREEQKKRQREEAKRRDQKALEEEVQRYYRERISPLTCPGVGGIQETGFAAVPKSHRTVVLAFYELKQRVCKPFRR